MPPLLSKPRYKAKTKDTRRMNILLLCNFNLFPSLRTYIRIPRTLHIQRHERSCKPSIRGIYAVRAHRGLRGRPTSVFRRHTRVYHAYASSLAYSNLEISDLAQQRRASMMRAQPIQNPCSGDYYRSVAVDRHVDHTRPDASFHGRKKNASAAKNVSFALRGARVARVIRFTTAAKVTKVNGYRSITGIINRRIMR